MTRLGDGNIWMTQNLDHDIGDIAGGKYTYGDTDIGHGATPDTSAEWTPDKNTYTTSTTTWAADNDAGKWIQESYDPGNRCWDGTVYTSGATLNDRTVACTEQSDLHYHIGNYYNFTAAIAMNNSESWATRNQDVDQSICPAGWRLPIGGTTNTGTKSFQYLIGQTGYTAGTSGNIHVSPAYFVYGGDWRGSSTLVGYSGVYWSSVVGGRTNGYRLYFYGDGRLGPKYTNSRYIGYSVRCVAR